MDDTAVKKLQIDIDNQQYYELQRKAKKQGLSSTGYIKQLVTRALKETKLNKYWLPQ